VRLPRRLVPCALARRLDEARRAHRRIAECIADGDDSGAEQAMTNHLSAFEAVVGEQAILDAPISGLSLP
jgi:DNA-binding FadR family transcriptional regulator